MKFANLCCLVLTVVFLAFTVVAQSIGGGERSDDGLEDDRDDFADRLERFKADCRHNLQNGITNLYNLVRMEKLMIKIQYNDKPELIAQYEAQIDEAIADVQNEFYDRYLDESDQEVPAN